MNLKYYNRYSQFVINGDQKVVPLIKLAPKSSDNVFFYKKNISRLEPRSAGIILLKQ